MATLALISAPSVILFLGCIWFANINYKEVAEYKMALKAAVTVIMERDKEIGRLNAELEKCRLV